MTVVWAVAEHAALGAMVGAAATAPLAWLGAKLVGRPMPRRGLALVLVLSAGLSAALAGQDAWLPALAAVLALALGLLAVVDAVSLRLPDTLTLPLALAGLLSPFGGVALIDRLVGAAVGFASLALVAAVFRRATGRSGLGLGDAKLFAAAGAWLGWTALPQVLLVACGVGLAWAALRVLIGGLGSLRQPIPFGGGLCAGLLAVWLLTVAHPTTDLSGGHLAQDVAGAKKGLAQPPRAG